MVMLLLVPSNFSSRSFNSLCDSGSGNSERSRECLCAVISLDHLAIRVHRMLLVTLGMALLHALLETAENVDTVDWVLA